MVGMNLEGHEDRGRRAGGRRTPTRRSAAAAFSSSRLKVKEFEERAAERDMDVLGFYHSHPDHPAQPSEYDREHAWPGYSYVIASVSGGERRGDAVVDPQRRPVGLRRRRPS